MTGVLGVLGVGHTIGGSIASSIALFVAGGTPLDTQPIARRLRVEIGGRVLFVHPPEDILLQKQRWYGKGGEVSDRQWRDILGIVRVQGTRLDRTCLRRTPRPLACPTRSNMP